MTAPITDERLAELEHWFAGATKGEWQAWHGTGGSSVRVHFDEVVKHGAVSPANAAFIAAVHREFAAMVARLREWRTRAQEAEDLLEHLQDKRVQLTARVAELENQIEAERRKCNDNVFSEARDDVARFALPEGHNGPCRSESVEP
jgi:hypothetical protein